MTEKEISELLGIPFDMILPECQDREGLRLILSRAINNGIGKGQSQMSLNFNKALLNGREVITVGN